MIVDALGRRFRNLRVSLTAVAAVGVTGASVALLFMLFSAPDLSITQIMVETLSLVLFVLLWPPLAHAVLLTLMAVGGCAGSTGGGIKVMRVLIAFKVILAELELVHDDPSELVEEALLSAAWGRHPLARPVIGSAGSVEALDIVTAVNHLRPPGLAHVLL